MFDVASRSSRRGGQRYPMAAYTSVRRRTGTVDISKAVNHRESAFLAPGRHDRSTIRLEVYFFLATRASRIAGRWAINDRIKKLPPGLVRLPFPLWTTRQTPRVPSDPHRSSTIDGPENQPGGTQKKPLNLLSRRRHGVAARPGRRGANGGGTYCTGFSCLTSCGTTAAKACFV